MDHWEIDEFGVKVLRATRVGECYLKERFPQTQGGFCNEKIMRVANIGPGLSLASLPRIAATKCNIALHRHFLNFQPAALRVLEMYPPRVTKIACSGDENHFFSSMIMAFRFSTHTCPNKSLFVHKSDSPEE